MSTSWSPVVFVVKLVWWCWKPSWASLVCYVFLFPSCFQHFLFVFNFGQVHEYVSWGVPPWVCFLLYSLCFLDLSEWFLSHVKEVFVMCSGPFSLSSASGTPIMQMLVHVMLFQSSHRLPPFLFNLFFSSVPRQWFPPVCLPSHLFIFLPSAFCYCFLWCEFFYFSYCVFRLCLLNLKIFYLLGFLVTCLSLPPVYFHVLEPSWLSLV